MLEIVGGVFTAVTVRRNESVALDVPSLTVTVIVAVPVWPLAGVIVTVRLLALPPKTIFAFGTSVVLEDPPVTTRLEAGVSASPTVNAMAGVAVSAGVD